MAAISSSAADATEPVSHDIGDGASPPLSNLQRLPDLVVEKEVHELNDTAAGSSAAAAAAQPHEAVGHQGDGSDGDDGTCPLIDLVQRHPELFEKEVLERLTPADRAFLGQVDAACRAAVVASDLPCAGMRVGMRQLNRAERTRLAREVRAMHPTLGQHPTLGPALGPLGYVESSDVPRRVGRVVRLELKEFCTSPERLAWAKEKGVRLDGWTCALAARGGHLEALRWAREHGCPWSSRTCRYAAEGGNWRCCSGCMRMGARGRSIACVSSPLGAGT